MIFRTDSILRSSYNSMGYQDEGLPFIPFLEFLIQNKIRIITEKVLLMGISLLL